MSPALTLSVPQSRRQFLNLMVSATFATAIAGTAQRMRTQTTAYPLAMPRSVVSRIGEIRDLRLFNANTRESAHVTFFANGHYNLEALRQLDTLLRDHHTNTMHAMDPALLTLAYDMQRVFDNRPLHVISAYRTRETNNALVRQHITTAKESFHIKGQAIDIRIPGVPTHAMRDVAKILNVGGVGYYPWAHFVHVDTGPVRYW